MGLFSKPNQTTLLPDPRDHHYVFAHQALRHICLADPFRFFAIIASDEQKDFVKYVWDTVKDHLSGTEAGFNTDDTLITMGRIKGYPTVFITMPEPQAVAEVHMIGIVLKMDTESDAPGKKVPIDYFTLELGQHLDGTLRTVLCKWVDDSHMNLGDGPNPVLQKFAAEFESRI